MRQLPVTALPLNCFSLIPRLSLSRALSQISIYLNARPLVHRICHPSRRRLDASFWWLPGKARHPSHPYGFSSHR